MWNPVPKLMNGSSTLNKLLGSSDVSLELFESNRLLLDGLDVGV